MATSWNLHVCSQYTLARVWYWNRVSLQGVCCECVLDGGNWYWAFITPFQRSRWQEGQGGLLSPAPLSAPCGSFPLTQCPHLSPFLACKQVTGKITNIERGGGDNTPGQTVHSQAIVARWPYFQHTHLLLLYGVILKPGAPVARATQGYSLTECVKSIGKQWKRNHSTMPRGTIDPPYIKGMLPECFSVTWGLTNKETWQGKLLLFHELQFSAGLAHSTPQAFSTAEVLPYSHRKLSQAG